MTDDTPLLTPPDPLAVSVSDDDIWLDEIWAWADEFGLSNEQVPRDKERLLALTRLDVASKGLTYLPESIGRLGSLQTLVVRDNQLTHLPKSIGELKNLQKLDIRDNQLAHLQSIERLGGL